jgi:hypothetical protein
MGAKDPHSQERDWKRAHPAACTVHVVIGLAFARVERSRALSANAPARGGAPGIDAAHLTGEMEMRKTHRRLTVLGALFCAAILFQACGHRSAGSTSPEHIRGTVQSLDGQVLTVATSTGTARVQLAQPTLVATVVESDREHITDGSFLGITSVTQPDGSERAVEVHVFPEAMRGTGEGSYAWDLPGVDGGGSKMTNGRAASSKMTNGTVSSSKMTNGTVAAQEHGSSLTLHYKNGTSGGSQTITIPPGIPVVAIEPGQPADLQPGTPVFVVAHRTPQEELTADRVLAGKNGVVPPM